MKRLNTLVLSLIMTGVLCMTSPFTFNAMAGGDEDEDNDIVLYGDLNDDGNRSLLDNATIVYTYPMLICSFHQNVEQLNLTITGQNNVTYYTQNVSVNANTSMFVNVGNYPNGNYILTIKDGQGGKKVKYFTVNNY